ncbi:MAG: ABC transporter permease [Bryobacteraceae bacterium]|nr:ABC transporter permease [Bryobacteraceae bacterium]MCX7602773.1 ABC transporter permease [Bryobacteraceae bacterium]
MTPIGAIRMPARLPGMMFLRVLRERRSLIYQMVRRDFEQRFVGSAAGWLWTLIHPLVLLLSWVFVFQFCLKVPPPPGVGDSYTLFLFCGYLPWLLFQETVQRSANSLVEQASLITKTVFPAEIIPVTLFLSALLSHTIAVMVAVVMVRWMTGHFSVLVLLLPVYTALLGLFAIGVGWLAASLQVFLRDTAQIVVVVLTGWFWLTPIFVDESYFPPAARFLVKYNPLALVVKGYRQRLMTYEPPSWQELALLAAVAGAAFFLGGIFFRHLKRGFADVL